MIKWLSGVVLGLMLATGAPAQTSEERVVAALERAITLMALPAEARQAGLEQLYAELLTLIGDDPDGPVARALLAPGAAGGPSVLRRLQMVLASDAAEPACGHADRILYLANRILAERLTLSGFRPGRYGASAAYLWLRYSNPKPDTAMRRLDEIARAWHRPPRGLPDLALAYAIHAFGPQAGAQAVGLTPEDALARAGPIAQRAYVLRDNGASFFAALQALRADPARAEALKSGDWDLRGLSVALANLPEATKIAISAQAEAFGHLYLASALLAALPELERYRAFVARHPEVEALRVQSPDLTGMPQLHHLHPTQPGPGQSFTPLRQTEYDIFRAGMQLGGFAYVNILYNMTGWEDVIGPAAQRFLRADAEGLVGADIATRWLWLYDDIAGHMDAAELRQMMGQFDVSSTVRHYGGRGQGIIDWMRATRDLAPYAAGQVSDMPPRSALLSPEFDWALWQHQAEAVRTGRGLKDGEVETKIAVELYWAAGAFDRAMRLAESRMTVKARVAFFRDVMARLDQSCAGYMQFPGQALLLGGQTIYRFE